MYLRLVRSILLLTDHGQARWHTGKHNPAVGLQKRQRGQGFSCVRSFVVGAVVAVLLLCMSLLVWVLAFAAGTYEDRGRLLT